MDGSAIAPRRRWAFSRSSPLTLPNHEGARGGRVVSCAVLDAWVAMTDTAEVLGVASAQQTGPAWNEFFADLVAEPPAACAWSPATRIWAWSKPSQRTYPEPPGNDAAPTTPANLMSVTPKALWPAVTCCASVRQRRRLSQRSIRRSADYVNIKAPRRVLDTSVKPGRTSSPSSFPTGVWTVWCCLMTPQPRNPPTPAP